MERTTSPTSFTSSKKPETTRLSQPPLFILNEEVWERREKPVLQASMRTAVFGVGARSDAGLSAQAHRPRHCSPSSRP